MTRPGIVRADTIDLQDPDSPPAPKSALAPHQAETLREVEEERAEEEGRSPRVSWNNGEVGDLEQYAQELASGISRSLGGHGQDDPLAVAQNGGHDVDERDMDSDGDDDLDDDDLTDKISSSPSIEDEDIDFEFVYALHTFVATVEGQANATKGDTMVLLDDSNSYWWLVRVVKDSSIGYLPAEHIETPTERLARLNKHRNIDLSASMLGDQPDKQKNSIKSAMKRRKAKNVTFTTPTFHDYSDHDYSSDEADEDAELQAQQQAAQQQAQQQQSQANNQQASADKIEEDESARVEPLKPRASQSQTGTGTGQTEEMDDMDPDTRRSSDDMFDVKNERTTRNGTVRNTDSFFKDETIETKKISLTPSLLQDANGDPRTSSESKETRLRASLEKELMSDKEKGKEEKKKNQKEKKEKEKKPSAFRSLFSRKDRKKSVDDDDESFGKRSMDIGTDSMDKERDEEFEYDTSPEKAAPQRNTSKLQKQQPVTESPSRKNSVAAPQPNNVANVPPATMRVVEPEQPKALEQTSQPKEESSTIAAIATKILPSSEPRPPKVTKAKSRVELDDFDSSSQDEDESIPEPNRAAPVPQQATTEDKPTRPTIPGAFPDSYLSNQSSTSQRSDPSTTTTLRPMDAQGTESPMQPSPSTSSNPPALMGDTSSQEDRSSPVSSPEPTDPRTHRNQDSVTTSTSATTTTSSTWNDTNLRAFFDSGSDIRDLLAVVYDKTDVPPAGPDHPIAGTLFREQNAKLAEITTQLDNMLGDWLARKQRLRGTF